MTLIIYIEDSDSDIEVVLPQKNQGKGKERAVSPDVPAHDQLIVAAKVTVSTCIDDEALARQLQEEEEREVAEFKAKEETNRLLSEKLAQRIDTEWNSAERKRIQDKAAEIMLNHESDSIFQTVIDVDENMANTEQNADSEENKAHLTFVRKYFEKTNTYLKIKRITFFVNPALEIRFSQAKAKLNEMGRPTEECILFHGTSEHNHQSILKGGLKIPGFDPNHAMQHGAALGQGIYLAADPFVSLAYTGGCSKMFACIVIKGLTTTQCDMQQVKPFGENAFDAYDSGGVTVAKSSHLVVPRYLVEFDQAHNPITGVPAWGVGPANPLLPVFPIAPPLAPLPIVPLASTSRRPRPDDDHNAVIGNGRQHKKRRY